MPQTPVVGIRYPNLSPDPPNVPADLQKMGQDIESAFALSVSDEATRDALPVWPGRRVYVASIGQLCTYDAGTSTWEGFAKDFAPAVTGTTATMTLMKRTKNGRWVEVEFIITLTAVVSGVITIATPFTAEDTSGLRAVGKAITRDTSVGDTSRRTATILLASSTTVSFLLDSATSAAALTAAVPYTWAAGDTIAGTYRYKAAA